MTQLYCEHHKYPAYTSVPSGSGWPLLAQEGDGLANGLAVSAHVEIDCTGITATAASPAFTILGTSFQCVTSGATTNQFNASSGATLATNLAAAINASTNVVSSLATGWLQHQLRNVLYAQATGAILQIMTRAGSALYNEQIIASSGMTGWPGTNPTFAGGASGSWGYLLTDVNDPATSWPSGVARGTYGCLFSDTAYASGQKAFGPIAGPALSTNSDNLAIRSSVSGASYTLATTLGNAIYMPIQQQAKMLVDDGAIWPSDTNTTLTIQMPNPGYTISLGLGSKRVFLGTKTYGRLVIEAKGGSGQYVSIQAANNGLLALSNVKYLVTSGALYFYGSSSAQGIGELVLLGGSVKSMVNIWWAPFVSGSYATGSSITVDGLYFDYDQSGYSGASGIYLANWSSAYLPQQFTIRNSKVSTLPNGQPMAFGNVPAGFTNTAGGRLVSENNSGIILNSTIGMLGTATSVMGITDQSYVVQQGIGQKDQFRYESSSIVVDALSGASYPTPSKASFSFGVSWGNTSNSIRLGGIEVVKLKKTITSSVSTASVELLMDPAIAAAIHQGYIAATAVYTTSTGTRTDYSNGSPYGMVLNPLPLATTTETWAPNGFSDYLNPTAVSIPITLSGSPVVGTNIEVSLYLYLPAPTVTKFFFSPEVTLT